MIFRQIHQQRPLFREISLIECPHRAITGISNCEEGIECSKCEDRFKWSVCSLYEVGPLFKCNDYY